MKGLRCENGAVNYIDPWTNAITEENRGKLRFKRFEEIDPLMLRQSRNLCSNDCAISKNPVRKRTVSGHIDNDAEMELVRNPDKNLVSPLANIFCLFHCIKAAIPICGIAVFAIGLSNDKMCSVNDVYSIGNDSGRFHLLKNFCLVNFLFNFDELSIDLFNVNDFNGRLTFSHGNRE